MHKTQVFKTAEQKILLNAIKLTRLFSATGKLEIIDDHDDHFKRSGNFRKRLSFTVEVVRLMLVMRNRLSFICIPNFKYGGLIVVSKKYKNVFLFAYFVDLLLRLRR